MRNILVHDYDRVEWPLVWDTMARSVPLMVAQIRPLLPELPADET